MVIIKQAVFIGHLLYVTCYAGQCRKGPGLTWETSIYITGTQAIWWSNMKATVSPGMCGNLKAWEKEVRLGLGLERGFERTLPPLILLYLQIPLGLPLFQPGAWLCSELVCQLS